MHLSTAGAAETEGVYRTCEVGRFGEAVDKWQRLAEVIADPGLLGLPAGADCGRRDSVRPGDTAFLLSNFWPLGEDLSTGWTL